MAFKNKTKNFLKVFSIIIALSFVLLIATPVTAYGFVPTGKEDRLEEFDTFFAFSGSDLVSTSVALLTAEEILASDLLSPTDKSTFEKEYKSKVKKAKGTLEFQIYLGVKDGKDMVCVRSANSNYSLVEFMFESNLEYTYDSVIKEFERLSGTTLTQEFLQDCERHQVLNQPGGITVFLVPNAEKTKYNLVFWSLINNQIYITSPEYIKAGVLY